MRRTLAIAAVAVLPFMMAACGKSDDNAADATSAASSATVSTTTTTTTEAVTSEEQPSSEAESTTTEPKPEEAPAPENPVEPPAAPAPQAPPLQVPQVEGVDVPTFAPVAPLESGDAATEADIADARNTLDGLAYAPTIRGLLNNMVNNTCDRVIEANGGRENMDVYQIPDMPIEQVPGYQRAVVEDISDAKIQGDEMSAQVTTNTAGAVQTATVRFHKEEGRWKVCD